MEASEVLDVLGTLISNLKAYGAKVPEVVPLASVPGGVKPKVEAVEAFEQGVSRFRRQSTGTKYQYLNEQLIEALEAFESGWMLKAVQALLMALDHLESMQGEQAIPMTRADTKRLQEYRHTLHKILPGNKPELKGAGEWM